MKKTRRAFIQKSAVAAASLTAAPFQNIFIQTKKIVEENPIVGHGDFKYRVDKEWGIQDPTQFPISFSNGDNSMSINHIKQQPSIFLSD